MKKLSQDDIIKRFIEQHELKTYNYSKVVYANIYTHVEIICSLHGSFFQTPKKHIKGQGCPKCSSTKKLTQEEFENKANKIHDHFYDYSQSMYKNNKTNVVIICPNHGMFKQTPANHIIRKQGCPSCAGVQKISKDIFIKRSNEKHSYFFDYRLVKEVVNTKTSVKIICPIHGVFKQTPGKHMNGARCSKCAGNTKLNQKDFETRAGEIHGNMYDYSLSVYINMKTKIKIVCCKHGIFEQKPLEHILLKRGCPCCIKKSKISKKQYNLYKKIKKKHVNTILEHRILVNNRYYFADIFIPEKNLIIEYYGDYWHCNPKKYNTDYYHKHKKMYAKDIWRYDENRKKELEELGYKVYIVWENKK